MQQGYSDGSEGGYYGSAVFDTDRPALVNNQTISDSVVVYYAACVWNIQKMKKEINSMFRLWMRLVCLSCTIQRCGLTWKESLLGLHTLTSATPQQQASMALPME